MFGLFKTPSIICRHEFKISDIKMSRIPPLEKPKPDDGYTKWARWYRRIYNHPSITHRVNCKCHKCGKVEFANCGLDLNGRLV